MPHENRNAARGRSVLSPGRTAALDIVRTVRVREAFTHEIADSRLARMRLADEDRAFARLLALGVARSVGTLDELIARALDKPTDITPEVRDCLRITAFEVFFLKKSPHAAVDQGVELVRSVQPKAAGFANFVLRRFAKMRDAFPFGDPARDDAALARLFAFPLWLTRLLVEELGREQAVRFMRASNEQAPVYLALNVLHGADAVRGLEELLCGLGAQRTDVPGCLRLAEPRALSDGRVARALNNGDALVSDYSAQRIASLVEGETVLEIGAGRGTKTILIQNHAMRAQGRQARLTAVDNRGYKTELLVRRAEQFGADVAETLAGDARKLQGLVGGARYGAVFIDAPCTGLGTLRRHPEIRWRLKRETIAELAETARLMLHSAAPHVEPGGSLVFSTCTVTHEENAGTVSAFLASNAGRDFRLEPIDGHAAFAPVLESGGCDAHFAVRLRRVR